MKKNTFLKTLLYVFLGLMLAGAIVSFVFSQFIVGGILAGLFVLLLILIIAKYNKMIRYKNKVSEALSLIDIHLKMRFDLVPNLVETVKGYAKHERETFVKTLELRALAVGAKTEKEKLEYSNQLVPKMKDIVMIAEDYPKLQADKLYKSLMEQLTDIEDRLVSSRRIYDSNVGLYNTLIQTFPNNAIAKIYGFEKETLFKIDSGENICPRV